MREIVMLVAALSLVSGCATMTKETFIHENAGAHTFDKSSDDVLAEARKVLVEKGYSFRGGAEGQSAIVTEWKEEMGNSAIAGSFSRYMVEAYPLDATHCRIRVTRNSTQSGSGAQPGSIGPATDRNGLGDASGASQTANGQAAAYDYANAANGRRASNAQLTRDLQFEWLLMQRVNPDEAQTLQSLAEERFK